MNYNSGQPAFVMPQMPSQPQHQSMDHSRMSMFPPHNMQFPPPTMHPPQFAPNMKFVQPMQPGVHPQAQFYPEDRTGHVYYQQVPPQPMFSRPPPQHYIQGAPFIQQQSIDAIAEQVKNASNAGPHIPPQNLQQMGHPIPPHLAHQGMAMVPPNQMHPAHHHYQRQPYSQNSLSRGQTPTTASHSGSKRSSPQNPHQTEATSMSQQNQDDYTPPGTPQELTPLDDDQKQQYILSLGPGSDKGMEMMLTKFNDTHFDGTCDPSHESHKPDQPSEGGVFDKPMEFFNKNFQNHDAKDWQNNVRAGEHMRHDPNFAANPNYDPSYNGRNDRRQPQPRQGRNQPNRPSQDPRYGNQQRGGQSQRFQQSMQQGQQRPRQMSDQWRSQPDTFVQPPAPEPAPVPERVTECSYCRMLGKPVEEYSNHIIRERDGKAVCNEIKKLQCPKCNATGEGAHAEYFCPKIDKTGNDLAKTANDLRAHLERRKQQPPAPSQNHQQQMRPQHYQQQPYHGGGRRH